MQTPTTEHPTTDRLIRLTEVLKIVPVSRAGFYNGMKTGHYPEPVRLSERCVAWRLSDIQKIVEGKRDE